MTLLVYFWFFVVTLLFIDLFVGILQRWKWFPTSMYRVSQRDGKFYAEYFLCGHNPVLGVYKGFGWRPVRYFPDNGLCQVYSKGSDVGYTKFNFAKEALMCVKAKIENNKNSSTYLN